MKDNARVTAGVTASARTTGSGRARQREKEREEAAACQKERSLLNLSVVIPEGGTEAGDKFHRERRPLSRTSTRNVSADAGRGIGRVNGWLVGRGDRAIHPPSFTHQPLFSVLPPFTLASSSRPSRPRRKSLRLTGSHGITGTRDIYASAARRPGHYP